MSRSHRYALVAWLLLVSSSCPLWSQEAEGTQVPQAMLVEERVKGGNTDWQPALERGLKKLGQLLSRGSPRHLGFKTKPEANALNVLEPMPQALIQVSDLRRFRKGQNAATLLRATDRLMFPLLVGDRVVSSLTLARISGAWQPVAFGSAALIRKATETRLISQAAVEPKTNERLLSKGRAADYAIVNVTGLNRYFLAVRGPAGLYLVPLISDPRLGLVANVPQLAEDVLLKLVPAAQAHNGLPT